MRNKRTLWAYMKMSNKSRMNQQNAGKGEGNLEWRYCVLRLHVSSSALRVKIGYNENAQLVTRNM